MARFGRDMVTYAVADLLGSSIGLILSPVFSRLLTPEQYGAQAALSAIWGFVAIAQYGGMDSAYPNFRSRTNETAERDRLRVTATFVAVGSAVAVSLLFGAVALLTDTVTSFAHISRWEMFAYILTLAPGSVMAWLLYILRYERKAVAFARLSLIGRVIGSIVLIPGLLWVTQENRMLVGFYISAAVAILATGIGLAELSRQGLSPLDRTSFVRETAAAMFRFGAVLIPVSAIYAVSTVLDRLLVTWFAGPAETAVLALAMRLGAIATMLRTWFALVWDPQLIDWIPTLSRESLLEKLAQASDRIARIGAVMTCLAALWSEPVVRLLYPKDYWGAISLVPWIVFGVAVSALSLVAVGTATLARTVRLHLPVYLLGLGVNFAVGCWWIPKIGAAGAVAGVVAAEASILAAWIFIGVRYLKNLPLPWLSRWGLLAVAGVFLALYRPGAVLSAITFERFLLSLVAFLLVGPSLARETWAMVRQLAFRPS